MLMVKPGPDNCQVNSWIDGYNRLRIKAIDYLPAYRSAAGTTPLTMGPGANVDSRSLEGLYKGFHRKILAWPTIQYNPASRNHVGWVVGLPFGIPMVHRLPCPAWCAKKIIYGWFLTSSRRHLTQAIRPCGFKRKTVIYKNPCAENCKRVTIHRSVLYARIGLSFGYTLNISQVYPIPGLEYINRFFTPLIYRVFVKIVPGKR